MQLLLFYSTSSKIIFIIIFVLEIFFFVKLNFKKKNHYLLIIQTISIDGSIWLLNLDDNLNFFLKTLCLERTFSNLFPPPTFEF